MENINTKTTSILKLTEVLRNNFQTIEPEKIIIPFILIKRLDSILQFSKKDVLNCYKQNANLENLDEYLKHASIDENGKELGFYNYSKFNLNSIAENEDTLKENLIEYISCFSENIQDIFKYFHIDKTIIKLSKYKILKTFFQNLTSEELDLSSKTVSNQEMGAIFEELLRSSKNLNFEAGEHLTPKDIVKLMANILLADENKEKILKIYDPACGSGGLLTCCEEILKKQNKNYNINLYGQEINPFAYAIAKSNLLIRGESFENIVGPKSTLSDDQYPNEKFDYMITIPPWGARWGNDNEIVKEAEKGFDGRFGAGLPRRTDSQLLFIQHMISKMNENSQSRIAIITSEPPLSSGDIGSGESNIRKWIFENDYLETVIALPGNLFYNTRIPTYLLIFTNKKSKKRKGKVQLINAKDIISNISQSKKLKITDNAIETIFEVYKSFEENENTKILDNEDFGYKKIVIERPLQRNYQVTSERLENLDTIFKFEALSKSWSKNPDEKLKEEELGKEKQRKIKELLSNIGTEVYTNRPVFNDEINKVLSSLELDSNFINDIVHALSEHDENVEIELNQKGEPKADPYLRESRKIPLKDNIKEYFKNQIENIYPNAWVDFDEKQIGYEINFIHLNYDEKLFFDDINYPISSLENLVKLELPKVPYEYELYLRRIAGVNQKIIYYPHEVLSQNPQNIRHSFIGCIIRDKSILKEYLYCYLNSNKGLEHYSYFQRKFHTNINDLSRLPIPLPDIETQKKIIETSRLMEQFFKEIEIWKTNYQNNIINYKPALDSYKGFSCSIEFGEHEEVSNFCRNWRIVYQGLNWPLAYSYLKATKGSKYDSTKKQNYLVLFEFLAAFNVIILISAIKESDISSKHWKEIQKNLWQLYNKNKKTWHNMHFGGWTKLYWRLSRIYQNKKYNFDTKINREFLNKLSQDEYQKLFNNLRANERNPEAHGGLEDDIDVEKKLETLQNYMDTDIFDILNLYCGYKLYYRPKTRGEDISPNKIAYDVLILNGPCDYPTEDKIISSTELDTYSLYLYDSLNNYYLKLDTDLIRFKLINDSKQYGIFIYDGIDLKRNVARYKCYQHKNEIMEVTLNTEEETFLKVSKEFKKDVVRL